MNIDLREIGILAKFLSEALMELDRLVIENRKQAKLIEELAEQIKGLEKQIKKIPVKKKKS